MLVEFLLCAVGLVVVCWFGYYLAKDE